MDLTSLFVDFDAYFASAEQHMQPCLRGVPVGVAPILAESSCCIAASYEAKAHGIKTGTRVSDARILCPGIQIVEARPTKYVELHHQLVAAVESCIHVEAVLSIDEMWCWLPYNLREPQTVEKIGLDIKRAIHDQVGPWINGSVGAAPNKWLAKMASKIRKPDGLLIINHDDLPEILYDLELRDIHGIGRGMELRLHAHGIHDVRALCNATRQQLHTAWGGVEGDRIWFQMRGKEIPEAETIRRSIGHSHVLPPEKRHPNGGLQVLHKLTQKAAQRLRSHGMLTCSYYLSLSYLRGGSWSNEMVLESTDDSLMLARAASHLWKQRPHHAEHLIKVSMVLGQLTHTRNYTPSLFADEDKLEKKSGEKIQALNTSMDKLVQKFGRQSIYLGGAHGALEAAPMRISFSHVPDLDIEKD
jgi:DNA polymerase-4